MNYCRFCNHILTSTQMVNDSAVLSHGRTLCTYCGMKATVSMLVTRPPTREYGDKINKTS